MDLIGTFRGHSRKLKAESETLDTVHHAGNRGSERESVLERFLTDVLPYQFGIGTGEIRATNGAWSKQEDLVIYDRLACPRLFVGAKSQVYPVESVAAIIEVKSKLGSAEIRDAAVNIAKARSLKKLGMSGPLMGPGSITFGEPSPTLGVLFAYDLAISTDTFRRVWDENQSALPPNQRINLTCILGQQVVIHIDRTFHLWDEMTQEMLNNFYAIAAGEDALLVFTLLLTRVLAETRFGVPDLFKYVFTDGRTLNFKNVYER